MDDLAQQMITLTRRVDDLTQQVARLTGQAQQIVQRQDQMQKTLDRLGSLLGPAVEDRMVQALRLWLEDRGWRLQVPVFSLTVNGIGELDGLVRAYTPEGAEVWLLVSVKSKVWPRDILNFVGFLQAPETAAALAAEGQPQAMWFSGWPWIAGRWSRRSSWEWGCSSAPRGWWSPPRGGPCRPTVSSASTPLPRGAVPGRGSALCAVRNPRPHGSG
ncbi:MAG: hypothetical protein C4314_02985 [Thermoflexus sp.]